MQDQVLHVLVTKKKSTTQKKKLNFLKEILLFLKNSIFIFLKACIYLRQPAVLVSTDSHSIWRGLQSSLGSLSQPECGMITSSVKACSAWSTISILIESWDERFHKVPGRENSSDSSPGSKTVCLKNVKQNPLLHHFSGFPNDQTPCSVIQGFVYDPQ
jgi:hypothetical protein